ncbi:MAG: DUF2459 domain-containing protein [Candidatus Rokuibacteriota bacterium]|nr:MAG: DUF2459 domain-containing protein [Candidatus Rokubacteria bacterium]
MVAWAAALVGAIVLAAGCLAPVADPDPRSGDEPAVTISVLNHGWHTAIVVRRADVDRALWPDLDDFPTAMFVEVAWGDRDFYMTTPATAWMAIRAAFLAEGSVLHVVGFDGPIADNVGRSEVVELRLTRRGFDAMSRFVSAEYQRDRNGQALRLQQGLYGSSWFYAARDRYHVFNTCNTWVARALRAAGLPVTPAGTITAAGVMRQAKDAAVSR